ncbi:hypothetical protein [Lacticaseibacillus sharpeae]|nr:hypothetical protein [Lacticaseibacillus sharpeae]
MNDKKTTVLGIISTAAAGTALLSASIALASGILTLVHGTRN